MVSTVTMTCTMLDPTRQAAQQVISNDRVFVGQ
jgi:hypothetical protein